MTYILLIYEFFKVGLFSVGGGLATFPFLFELVGKYPWFTAEELTNMIAVSESTPGPIGVNMATYVGLKTSGILGGVTSTLALAVPSLVSILIVAQILEKFRDSLLVKDLFYGLRAAVAGLIGVSVVNILSQNLLIEGATDIISMFDYKKIIIFALMVFAVFKFKKHPIVYIICGGIFGILLGL